MSAGVSSCSYFELLLRPGKKSVSEHMDKQFRVGKPALIFFNVILFFILYTDNNICVCKTFSEGIAFVITVVA